jgi:DNA transformation protein and related proteins
LASRQETADLILDQLSGAGTLTARRMFGEFAVYLNGKVVAMICDDQLFLKPTPAGERMLPMAVRAAPYPRGKPHIVVPGDRWDDADWMCELVRRTAEELPTPKPRRPKA